MTLCPHTYLITSVTWKTLSVIFQKKMESIWKILENFSLVIYPVRFRRYSSQDCIFIAPDIINHQLRITMGSTQWKIIKTSIENIIDVPRVHNITTNITKLGGNQIQTWTAEVTPYNRQKTLNCVHACMRACVCVCQRNPLSYPQIFVIPVQLSLEIIFLK